MGPKLCWQTSWSTISFRILFSLHLMCLLNPVMQQLNLSILMPANEFSILKWIMCAVIAHHHFSDLFTCRPFESLNASSEMFPFSKPISCQQEMASKRQMGYKCRIAGVLLLLLASIAALVAVVVIQDTWTLTEYDFEVNTCMCRLCLASCLSHFDKAEEDYEHILPPSLNSQLWVWFKMLSGLKGCFISQLGDVYTFETVS